MNRRQPKVRTLAQWGARVNGLLEDVDRMVRKHEGRDTRRGARPKETTSSCVVYPRVPQ